MIGEIALLLDQPRGASAVAVEKSRLIKIAASDVLKLDIDTPYLHLKLWENYCLHTLENSVAANSDYQHLSKTELDQWFDGYTLSELERGADETAPEGLGFLFVAYGRVRCGDEEKSQGSLIAYGSEPMAIVALESPTRVIWLPQLPSDYARSG